MYLEKVDPYITTESHTIQQQPTINQLMMSKDINVENARVKK